MADRILLSANLHNLEACAQLAVQYDFGIESLAFSDPNVLDGDWEAEVERHHTLLDPIRGVRSLHGPFMDMAPGSPDPRIIEVTAERYRHAIHIASLLDAEIVVFHVNFIRSIRRPVYRDIWHDYNVKFWREIVPFAADHNVTVAVENMWEPDPILLRDLMEAIDQPHFKICLDVGHSLLFSEPKPQWTLDAWISTLQPWLVHTHLNNNDGRIDYHNGFDNGVQEIDAILNKLRALPRPPNFVLEIDEVDGMVASVPYLKLKETTSTLRD